MTFYCEKSVIKIDSLQLTLTILFTYYFELLYGC